MKISAEAEKYADTLFFNESRLIHEKTKEDLRKHKFVNHEDTANKDYSLQLAAATAMAGARIESYLSAYEHEGENVEHEDVLEFIKAARKVLERQSNLISTLSGGTITMVRNQWSPDYRDQMITYFRDKAFSQVEPRINEVILKSKTTSLKKAARKKMTKRNELFRWIFDQCEGKQYTDAHLRNFLESNSDWTENDLSSVSDYLEGEGLIEQKDDSGLLVWLTHEGVKAGDSPAEVDSSTKASIVQHTQHNIFNAAVGAVQQGDQNIANVAQSVGANLAEVADLLKELRNHIDPEHREDGIEYIDAIEEELAKDVPKESRLRVFLKGVGDAATEAGKVVVGEITKKLLSGEISL